MPRPSDAFGSTRAENTINSLSGSHDKFSGNFEINKIQSELDPHSILSGTLVSSLLMAYCHVHAVLNVAAFCRSMNAGAA